MKTTTTQDVQSQYDKVEQEYRIALQNFDNCMVLLRLDPQKAENHKNFAIALGRLMVADNALIRQEFPNKGK